MTPPPLAWAPLRRGFARVAATSVLAGALIAAAVFVLVPRGIGLRQWGEFGQPKGTQSTGFTDEVEPGKGLVLKELHPGVTLEDVKAKTGCAFRVAL